MSQQMQIVNVRMDDATRARIKRLAKRIPGWTPSVLVREAVRLGMDNIERSLKGQKGAAKKMAALK
ncbi:MAG: hypothetical protein OSB57_01875 [Planctomycetota bacterium]|nr:hypothetical protein [Planctomycetota bacterium]